MDTGDILIEERFGISERETTLSLGEIVSQRAALLLGKLLLDFDSKAANARPQTGEAVYCFQIKKEAGLLDWSKSALEIDARIRAYTPWPLSFTRRGKDMLFILEAEPLEGQTGVEAPPAAIAAGTVLGIDKSKGILVQTGDGILAVSRLQWQAKKALDWKSFLNGERGFVGTSLGSGPVS
jgi:methionyl-tRNA formyltransferase